MFTFASTYLIHQVWALILVGVCARMMSGMGSAIFLTSLYSQIPLMFPTNMETMFAISELAAGIGFLSGPVMGSLLYNLGGYVMPFFIFGGLAIGITPIVYISTKYT